MQSEPITFEHLVADLKVGDKLINKYGDRAVVLDLLPNDPEYCARLREADSDATFCALTENYAAWHVEPLV